MCESNLEVISFDIREIEHGWIFAAIGTQKGEIILANSYLGGLQMPKTFLSILAELLLETDTKETDTQSKWICWHGENNSYIWHLETHGQSLILHIYEGGGSFGLPLQGNGLQRQAESADLLLGVNTLLYPFALSVCNAMKVYSYGKGYEKWQNSQYRNTFPREEYQKLRRILRYAGYQ